MSLKGILHQKGLIYQLMMLTAASVFFSFIGWAIWQLFTNADPQNISSLKTLQLLQSTGTFVIPPLLVAYFWSQQPVRFLQLNRNISLQLTCGIIIIMALSVPFVNLLSQLNHLITFPTSLAWLEELFKTTEQQAQSFTQQMLTVHSPIDLLANLFIIAMIPAIGEELFFRGIIQGGMTRSNMNPHAAIWITAFLFSAVHMQFYGLIPRTFYGALLGYLLIWSGNMWYPVIAHFANNAMAVIYYYFKNKTEMPINSEKIGTNDTLWLGAASGLSIILGMWLLKRLFQKSNKEL